MLKSLEIRNFQAHKHSTMEFSPGMNVITGTSDSGKSAIIRSMLWLLNNRPAGEAFKRWNTPKDAVVDVTMEFDNDYVIKSRVNGKNRYETEKDGSFEALRSDVPEQVTDITNITDYNIQTQFQPYFLLQDSSGDRARKLNDLVGLSIIDSVFKKLNGKIQTTKTLIKRTETEITALKDSLDEFKNLDSAELLIAKISKDMSESEVVLSSIGSVRDSIQKLKQIDEQITEKSKILKIERDHHLLVDKIESHHIDVALKDCLYELICSIHNVNDQLKEDTEWLAVEKPFNKLRDRLAVRDETSKTIDDIDSRLDTIDQLTAKIETENTRLDKLIFRYTEILTESGMCPTCNNPITTSTTNKIKSTLKEQ